jgi:cytochrome c peroxidase
MTGIIRCILVTGTLALAAGRAAAQDFPEKPPKPPLGLPALAWPEENLYSKEKAELGWLLYFDKRLSGDLTVSCASCHVPEKAFTDGEAVSIGIKGQKGGRSAPTVINRFYSTLQFWDGRAESLEEQAKGPIANPLEMTLEKEADKAHEGSISRLRAVPGYVSRFKKVFESDKFDINQVAKAIATFERTVYSGNAPFDRYQNGDKGAMTEAQIRGMDVFYNKATCDSCHIGFNFTDGSFANIGIGMDKKDPDLGRYIVTGREEERGAFKTPTLREIEHTGPYMHDGRFKTLEEVVDHYDQGGIKNKYLDQRMKPLKLTKQDKSDLVAFLKALSGEGWQKIKPPTEKQFPK